jgi:CRP-like cAMP-binding protein
MIATEALSPCELFSGLSEEELEQIAALASEEAYGAGELICAERELADRLFILCEGRGQLHVHLRSPVEPDGELTIEEVAPGQVFGWSSLVKQRQFTASVTALEPVKVIAFGAEELNTHFEGNPHTGFVVMKQLAEVIASRLHRTREACRKSPA